MTREKKIALIKDLFAEVSLKNYQGIYGLGTRSETPRDAHIRSKSIRAFLVDLLGSDDEDEETSNFMHLLENAIDENIYGNDEKE